MRKRPFVKAGKPAGNGLLLGYARVSKGDDQTNTLQARALRAAGCRRIFEEAASGGRWDRPELHRLLDHLREGDTLVVWKLDRLSRSLKDVLHIMERIAAAGAAFQSLTENIDTTSPAGRMSRDTEPLPKSCKRVPMAVRAPCCGAACRPWQESWRKPLRPLIPALCQRPVRPCCVNGADTPTPCSCARTGLSTTASTIAR
jgi:Resolvase, N terminal domain